MSSSISVVYGPGGRSVSVKTTPTTTLQAILVSACASMPNTPSPDSYTLMHNTKTLDLTLPLRFANFPHGAKLTLTPRSAASRRSSPQVVAASSDSPNVSAQQQQKSTPTVKVALQLVGSSRIIADFEPSATLWDIIIAAQTSSGRTLNLVNKFRPAAATATSSPPASMSPTTSEAKSPWGSGFLQTLISSVASRSGSSSPQQQQQVVVPPVAQSWYYQQPVLLLLNKEYASNSELQNTTLRSLGFTGGSVMVRFSYRAAKEPTSLEAISGTAPGIGPASPVQSSPQTQPETVRPDTQTTKASPVQPPPSAQPAAPTTEPATHSVSSLGIVDTPAAAATPTEPKTGLALVLSSRQVRVLGAPPANAPALASRIVLPDSFYDSGSDDLRILASAQRARVAESEKGFSSREKQEEEERRRHAEYKTKYSRTLIRFRFPDQIQVQAAFSSHDETVAELYAFLAQILVAPEILDSLIIQPPALNLDTLRCKTLFDAKLAPTAVVHVKLASSPQRSTLELLRPAVAALTEDLVIPSPELVDIPATISDDIGESVNDDSQMPQQQHASLSPPPPQPKSGGGTAAMSDGPKMPKWFLAGQKR
ncbi:hypothetical protein GGI00_002355 [Coemansia sp. RSA 2681]|nr:hypothetical protein GGI00_002355 [Coemansia sp. RSA 2681]